MCNRLSDLLYLYVADIAGGQGIQQAVSDSSQVQSHPHPQRNTAFLCKAGCETVQEIVMRTNEVFTQLKNVPVGSLQVHKRIFSV